MVDAPPFGFRSWSSYYRYETLLAQRHETKAWRLRIRTGLVNRAQASKRKQIALEGYEESQNRDTYYPEE